MALRNQPYFPLYVQDYLTDEKLNMCSWSTQGIYIKILCVLHKQKEYGKIVLFKQTDKQTKNICLDFASVLIKNIPCTVDDMIFALNELIFHEVIKIEDEKLLQPRMVKDGHVSDARSKAGKSGGGNPNLFKQNNKQQFKQTDKQNTEYENEYVNENKNEVENEVEKEIEDLETRKMKFYNSVGLTFSNQYPESLLKEFCDYWTEHNAHGKRMRHEMEKVFDINKRLITWNKNNLKFKNNGKHKPTIAEMRNDYKDGIIDAVKQFQERGY